MPDPHAHPDLGAEQAYIDSAYAELERMRARAQEMLDAAYKPTGKAFAAVQERESLARMGEERLERLEIGQASLVFGRIDRLDDDTYYIGRRGVFGPDHELLVVDWRVPVAESFYRATGLEPMGLRRRRHFLCEGQHLLNIEDEDFAGEGALGLAGSGALMAALEAPRAGFMRDIVSTIQAEQDRIIRDDIAGVLAVQGGPGTGKTAVALHRAAYLLYTHREHLERQGLLIVGPNRLFLRYIEQVLPALGESGASLVTLEDLVPGVRILGHDDRDAARVKGDARMAKLIAHAVTLRQRQLRNDVVITYEEVPLTLSARWSAGVIASAKRNRRPHNPRRAMLRSILIHELYGNYLKAVQGKVEPESIATKGRFAHEIQQVEQFRKALDYMWPPLTPQRLLAELYSSKEALHEAARRVMKPHEADALYRQREPGRVRWTRADLALLDEAEVRLGAERIDEGEHYSTFGHIVVDEVQDLSPMELRMLARRFYGGSMTLVGDVAQSVGAWAPDAWEQILEHLPSRTEPRRVDLSINYRTPSEIMACAEAVLSEAIPGMKPPESVRSGGDKPRAVRTSDIGRGVVTTVEEELAAIGEGMVAVVASEDLLDEIEREMKDQASLAEQFGRDRLDVPVVLVDVETAKGLEFDAVVVVEPARIAREVGLRALYVCLTRATKRLAVVHSEELPRSLREALV